MKKCTTIKKGTRCPHMKEGTGCTYPNGKCYDMVDEKPLTNKIKYDTIPLEVKEKFVDKVGVKTTIIEDEQSEVKKEKKKFFKKNKPE